MGGPQFKHDYFGGHGLKKVENHKGTPQGHPTGLYTNETPQHLSYLTRNILYVQYIVAVGRECVKICSFLRNGKHNLCSTLPIVTSSC